MTDLTTRKRGRPRDPEIDDRLMAAAVAVFANRGWAGFSIERVASEARVGKGSVYLRWGSASELLREALQTKLRFVDDPDTGNLRRDLLSLAAQLAEVYAGDNGKAFLRIYIEGDSIPGFREYWEFQQDQMRVARSILYRGQDRGEVSSRVRATTILDALSGGILVHSLTAPAPVAQSSMATRRLLEELVDLVLSSVDEGTSRG
ncbi:TetR/AcrR family transcriptional regulator [Nocardia abscessus]|uniref:TetR/AcrR family transcriptional regulator n=1 Tax=Nocardia abscessus TaxID=120957 RepID=UPI0024566E3A|nr:TetR/AcrR family transcriptional regulator [Nocardia abscessus]